MLVAPGLAQDKPYEGITLNVASQNDQFAAVMADLAPQFTEKTGATVKVDILSYPELLTKVTSDYIGDTKGYDIATMDIVWAGQFAETGWTVELSDLIKRDAAEINVDDIYPILMNALGNYDGKQVAFPFAGYANVLAYRTDLYEAAGLEPPDTMEELVADAMKLTDPSKPIYGFVANGQKGPAVAQDWMQYNAQMGGSIVDADGKPALNSDANVKSLEVYKELFDKAAPPGAADYDWGGREESFRQGLVANMQTWSVGAAGYGDPAQSKVVGKYGIKLAPPGEGLPKKYGVGGWGLAINADIDAKQQEAAWAFIKWITSPAVHKEMNMSGAELSPDQRDARRRPSRQVSVPAGARRDLHERRRRLPPAHPAISADPGHPRHGGERGAGRRRRAEEGARRRAGGSREAVLGPAVALGIVVIAGLDPAIHAVTQRAGRTEWMPVKSGHDDEWSDCELAHSRGRLSFTRRRQLFLFAVRRAGGALCARRRASGRSRRASPIASTTTACFSPRREDLRRA